MKNEKKSVRSRCLAINIYNETKNMTREERKKYINERIRKFNTWKKVFKK